MQQSSPLSGEDPGVEKKGGGGIWLCAESFAAQYSFQGMVQAG